MASPQKKNSQLSRIMGTLADKKCKNSRKVLKTRSAIQLQNWWRGIRRQDMRKLCEQTLVRDMHLGAGHPYAFSPSWKFVKNENISAATLYFLTWENGWTHRAGPWRFYSSYHTFRTRNEYQYLIADLVWGSVPPSKAAKRYGAKGEILYDPVLRQFILEERSAMWTRKEVTVFESIEDVLIHVRYKNQVELQAMRERSASLIQYFWREAHGYKYVRPRAFGEQTDSDDSDSE